MVKPSNSEIDGLVSWC